MNFIRSSILMISGLVLFQSFIFGQNTDSNASIPYSRNSISVVFALYSDQQESIYMDFLDSLKVPDKFDHNIIPHLVRLPFTRNTLMAKALGSNYDRRQEMDKRISVMKASAKKPGVLADMKFESAALKAQIAFEDSMIGIEMVNFISSDKLANKALSSVLIDPKLQYMTTEVIDRRGMYNANDAEYLKAMNSAVGIEAIKTSGYELLKNMYLFVFSASPMMSTSKKDNANAKDFSISGSATLLKINLDNLIGNGEFDKMIFTAPDANKYSSFMQYNFPLQLISSTSYEGNSKNYTINAGKTAKALLKSVINKSAGIDTASNAVIEYKLFSDTTAYIDLINNAIASADANFTKTYESFRPRTTVFSKSPIGLKLGKKESLRTDDLYYITERVLDKTGVPKDQKVGWVRARKIVDNRYNSTGNTPPSLFYSVAGKSVKKGMTARYVPETGFFLGVAYSLQGGGLKGDITSVPLLTLDYITKWMPGLRLSFTFGAAPHKALGASQTGGNLYYGDIEGGGTVANLVKDNDNLRGNKLYMDLNIQKIIQVGRVEITPLAGVFLVGETYSKVQVAGQGKWKSIYDAYSVGFKDSTSTVSGGSLGFFAGMKFGINISRNAQIYAGVRYLAATKTGKLTENEDESKYFTEGWWYTNYKFGMRPMIGVRLLGLNFKK